MKPRTTIILSALALALFGFIFFFERHTGSTGAQQQPTRILPTLSVAAVTTVSVRPLGQTEIVATRAGALWRITQPLAATAHPAAIEALLQTLARAEWHKHLPAAELKNRFNADREFGFDPAPFTLHCRQGDEKFEVQIGARTALGDELFVQVSGGDGIYVIGADLLKLLPHSVSAWRDPGFVNLQGLAFDRITVTNGLKTFELQRAAADQPWRMTRPLEARADNPKIASLLEQLQTLRAVQFVTDDPKSDLEPYGLQPPAWSLTLAQGANPVLALAFGKNSGTNATQLYARRADQTGVALVAGENLAAWRAAHEEFRDRRLAGLNGVTVDAIEVRAAESFTVRRETNEQWAVTAPEKFPADAALVQELLGAIDHLSVTQFVKAVVTEPDLPNYGLAPAATRISLKAGPEERLLVALDFSAAADGKVFARRSDDSGVYALRAADLRRLHLAGWQLRARRLWTFSENDVTRLVIAQRGETRELLREGENKWGFATNSQGIINPFAVEETVHRLGELEADTWVGRGSSALPEFGFTNDPVRLTVTVKHGEQAETHTLDFSGATPGRPPYGAVTLDGQPWIFECPPAIGELVRRYLMLPAN